MIGDGTNAAIDVKKSVSICFQDEKPVLKDTSPIIFIHPRKALFDAHSSSKIGSEATASVETANVEKVESRKKGRLGWLLGRPVNCSSPLV